VHSTGFTSRTEHVLSAVARWIVTAAVMLSVWLLASAEPWAYLLICGLVALGTLVWLLALATSPSIRLRAPLLAVVLALLSVLVAVQAVPLPASIVATVNGFAATVLQASARELSDLDFSPLTGFAMPAGGIPMTLSLAAGATRRSLFLIVAYVSVFLVLANTIRRRRHLRGFLIALTISSFLLAVAALAHKFSGSRLLFWTHEPRYGGNIFGPFTNRNHYAAYINMMFGVALGLFLALRYRVGPFTAKGNLVGFSGFTSRRASHLLLAGFTLVLFGGSLCATLSRGGMVSLLLSLMLGAGILAWLTRSLRAYRSIIAAVCLLMATAFFWLGGEALVDRLGSLSGILANPLEDFRAIVTRDTLRLFAAVPVVGSGFGTYRHVFPIFQTPGLQYRWLHAHNDWAQLMAEGGVVGTALFLGACGLWGRAVWRRLRFCDPTARLLAVGCLLGLATMAVHSFFDYSLHKPANAMTVAALAAAALAGAHLRRRTLSGRMAEPATEEPSSAAGDETLRMRSVFPRLLALLLVALLGVLLLAEVRDLRSELAYSRFLYLRSVAERTTDVAALRRVVTAACNEVDLAVTIGNPGADELADMSRMLLQWVGDDRLDRDFRTGLLGKSLDQAQRAVIHAPSNYLCWLWLGRASAGLGAWDAAERCLMRARELVLHGRDVRMFETPEQRDPMQDPAMREWIEGLL
jgi:hypothetical protein